MAFSVEDKHVNRHKRYIAKQLFKMFPNKGWTLVGLKKLIRRLTSRVPLLTSLVAVVHTGTQIEQLTLSQEDAPRTHSTQREIVRQVGISVASLNTVIKKRSAP